jgi:hypothetical protein
MSDNNIDGGADGTTNCQDAEADFASSASWEESSAWLNFESGAVAKWDKEGVRSSATFAR